MKSIQPDVELRTWEKLATVTKGMVLDAQIFLNDRRLVSRRDLRRVWNCSDETLKGYAKRGLPKHELSSTNFSVYDLRSSEEWRTANVDPKAGGALRKSRQEFDPEDENSEVDVDIDKISYDEADRRKKITDLKLSMLKVAEAEGRLVPADDLDKAMAEQAIMHKTDKLNDEKVLPLLLEGKSASEIATLLYEHNQERLAQYDKLINTEFTTTATLYDIVEAVLQALAEGISPDQIVEAVNASV